MGRTLLHIIFEEPFECLVSPIKVGCWIVNTTMNNPLRHALQALQLATVYKILTDTKITESDGFYGHVFEFSLDTPDALPLIWSEWHVLH